MSESRMSDGVDGLMAEVRALTAEVRADRATVDTYRAEAAAYRAEITAWRTETQLRFDHLDREVQRIAEAFFQHRHGDDGRPVFGDDP